MIARKIKEFFQLESIGGILLFIASILAILTYNYFTDFYDYLIHLKIAIAIDKFNISKPSELWVNDGLMAIFFFVIGLEIKREVLAGDLKDPKVVMLPVIGAVFGMLVPAIIYIIFNWENSAALNGWAIPSATDIAFALGVLSLLGKRVPNSLKLFLMTLAIADDIGAILIIAIFYTTQINTVPLMVAILAVVTLFVFNRTKVLLLAPYLIAGVILWVAMLKSGVHATIAGVITAMFIPYTKASGYTKTLLEEMEHDLHPVVTYFILPVFAFVNMGIAFEAFSIENLVNNVSMGIVFGLFFGNQIGIFSAVYLATKFKIASMPEGTTYLQIYGVSVLCGIGFTMSLFIGKLAFFDSAITVDERFAIVVGSMLSAIVGYLILYFAPAKKQGA
jgi:NhaA family Na+:H+ antiporter